MMEKRTLRVLEFDTIVERLKQHAISQLGKKRIDKMQISTEERQVLLWQSQTTEAQTLVLQSGFIPFGSFYDTDEAVKRARLGAVLDMQQLLHIATGLQSARKIKDFLSQKTGFSNLSYFANTLAIQRDLEEDIFHAIISPDEMADSASSELRRIRRSMVTMKESVRKKLDDILSSAQSKYLQESIVTMRQDRFVVPVKVENKDKIPGLVHDTSSSGATLFVEPIAVVEINNKLQSLKSDEKQEIHRILMELTARVAEFSQEIRDNQAALTELDFIFARGKLSVSMKAEQVEYNKEMKFHLKQARHPLIDPRQVVSSDIQAGSGYRTLVITGPNTGGKTVTLKTVGLFALMFQSGLHLPCNYGSSMCIFENIFADIGDEQSIEQSLSTFSSHMTHIVDILNHLGEKNLVLFDELGAGTDPIEGAELAIAILEEVKKRDSICIATTHYSELKHYALTQEEVENASMEFDVNTLSPTYRLVIGLPGKSNAFEISKRLGLSEDIIESAKSRIHTDKILMEDVLKEIEEDRKRIASQKEESDDIFRRAKQLEEKLEMQEEKAKRRAEKQLQDAKREVAKLLREAQEEVELQLREIADLKEQLDREDLNKELEKARKRIKDTIKASSYDENILYTQEDVQKALDHLEIGMRVYVSTFHQEGTILSVDHNKREASVQMGAMKMNLPYEILQAPKKEKKTASYTGEGKIRKQKSMSIKTEIDLRGMDMETARLELEKYLDDAVLSNVGQVTIIHGVGTMVLKKGVEQILRDYKPVKKFRQGKYGEGGPGVTIVTF